MEMGEFSSYLDFVESLDSTHPCPSYSKHRDAWWSDVEEEFYETVAPEIEGDETVFANTQEFLETCITAFFSAAAARGGAWSLKSAEARLAHVKDLLAKPHIPQRTPEWYAQTRGVLTASEFSSILGTPRMKHALVAQKTAPPPETVSAPRLACSTREMSAMDWGVRFEPVIKQVLGTLWGAEIVDVGRLLHPTDSRLAASPDGLFVAATDPARVGRLVEIKCPISREITGKIPFEYWCQMQIQMEVTDIDECDYVEVRLCSAYKDTKVYTEPEAGSQGEQLQGRIWLLQHIDTFELSYAYTEDERERLLGSSWTQVEDIPWHVEKLYTETVVRDREWFASTEAKRAEFWADVAAVGVGSYIAPPPTKRRGGVVVQVCKIED